MQNNNYNNNRRKVISNNFSKQHLFIPARTLKCTFIGIEARRTAERRRAEFFNISFRLVKWHWNGWKKCCIMDLTLHTCENAAPFFYFHNFPGWRAAGIWRTERRKKYCMLNDSPSPVSARRLSVKYIFQSRLPYIKCQELLNYTRSSTQSERCSPGWLLRLLLALLPRINLNFMWNLFLVPGSVCLVWWNKL